MQVHGSPCGFPLTNFHLRICVLVERKLQLFCLFFSAPCLIRMSSSVSQGPQELSSANRCSLSTFYLKREPTSSALLLLAFLHGCLFCHLFASFRLCLSSLQVWMRSSPMCATMWSTSMLCPLSCLSLVTPAASTSPGTPEQR